MNATFINESSNPCKAAWGLINKKRWSGGSVAKTDFATSDDFNFYFLESVDDILSKTPNSEPSNLDCLNYLVKCMLLVLNGSV